MSFGISFDNETTATIYHFDHGGPRQEIKGLSIHEVMGLAVMMADSALSRGQDWPGLRELPPSSLPAPEVDLDEIREQLAMIRQCLKRAGLHIDDLGTLIDGD